MLQRFFRDQVDDLLAFMASTDQVVRVVQVASDLNPVLERLLLGLDAAEDNPHVMVAAHTAFRADDRFFAQLFESVMEQNELFRAQLANAGVELAFPCTTLERTSAERALIDYLEELADSLPNGVGS